MSIISVVLLPSHVYNMRQDMKSARLIAVCKRTFKVRLHTRFLLRSSSF